MKSRTADIYLIEHLCTVAGSFDLLVSLRGRLADLAKSVALRCDGPILDWFIEAVSFQGISDQMARRYIDDHTRFSSREVLDRLPSAGCPKLTSYWSFDKCGFEKTWATCAQPSLVATCPLADLDLRNGHLSQTAYSLVLFWRDVADGDLVSWIDARLRNAIASSPADPRARSKILRFALLDPLGNIFGISSKVLSMALSDFLLGTGTNCKLWVEAGAGMIAVDSLVHNWMHRTGVIHRWGKPHRYGPDCYQPDGCADVIEALSFEVDARQFDLEFPQFFPRFVQKAIWSFCAQTELDRCNGNRIDDRVGCRDDFCPLREHCDRRRLHQ